MKTITLVLKNGNVAAHYIGREVGADGTVRGEGYASSAANAVFFAARAAGSSLRKADVAQSDRQWSFMPEASDVPASSAAMLQSATYEECRAVLG
jgi:hypothetical protein